MSPLEWHDPKSLTETAQNYTRLRPRYVQFADEVARIITDAFGASGIKCQSISSRAKLVDSFDRKCKKTTEAGSLKYDDPMNQITDLAGVRIITYTLSEVERVSKFVEAHFQIRERKDVGDERFEQGQFGYQSIHYLAKYSEARLALPEFRNFRDFICEIQIRTVLQHVWAEIEHGIQYKSQAALPKSIKRKFTSLAGLLEIGDREFESIQADFDRIKESVLEDFQADLTRVAIAVPKQAVGGATNGFAESDRDQIQGVRALVSDGRYQDAIAIYDRKISIEPKSYTLFLGRAKAKFLSGDTAGAEADLRAAEALSPNASTARVLREQIVEGNVSVQILAFDVAQANTLTNDAHEALRAGEGERAYLLYSEAQDVGASRPFSIFNKAMACVLSGDYPGGLILLGSLTIRSNTPMEVNIRGLLAIIAALTQSPNLETLVNELRASVISKGDFSFELSPLTIFEQGIRKSLNGQAMVQPLEAIFAILRNN